MSVLPDNTSNSTFMRTHARRMLALLLCFHIVTCCLSLIEVADLYVLLKIVMFDKAKLYAAALNVAPFALVAILFTFSRFSFGYFLGFYFYTVILGYLWLVQFSRFNYDHRLASVSAFISALAFLLPALFITSPVKQRFVLSARALDRLLSIILILAAAVVAVGGFYNFRLLGVADIYASRVEIRFPTWLGYAIGGTSNAMLPFAFACFVARGNWWRSAAVLLLLLLLYPVTLTKLALFSPFWLLFLALLCRPLEARMSVVLSLFLPVLCGVILMALPGAVRYQHIIDYFGAINFRMIAFPSIAIDVYSDFFSTHARTYFCQISFLKPLMACPYNEYLSIVMERTYQLGNLNASLFATEGIASVGPVLTPLAALACGLVISLANGMSSGLPSRFILLSGGILPQVFLNVPFTTTLLTGGAAFLFLLWYVTPRTMFEQKPEEPLAAAS